MRGAADLAALRQLPGVKAASATNQIPFGHSSWNWGVSLTPDAAETNDVEIARKERFTSEKSFKQIPRGASFEAVP